MIPLTFLYDEYIDRPQLSEQKKTIWVYSSSPHKWGRNNNSSYTCISFLLFFNFLIFTTRRVVLLDQLSWSVILLDYNWNMKWNVWKQILYVKLLESREKNSFLIMSHFWGSEKIGCSKLFLITCGIFKAVLFSLNYFWSAKGLCIVYLN